MSRLSLLGLSLVLLTPLGPSACDKSNASNAPAGDAHDELTRALLEAIARDDRDAALELSTSALAIDLDPASFSGLSETMAWLGSLERLRADRDEPVEGGVRRRYVANFARGELSMEVTIVASKVEGLELDEGQWEAFEALAIEAGSGKFRLSDFHFVGPEGSAVDNPARADSIPYALVLDGLDAEFREHHVTIAKLVYDGEGNEVYSQASDDNIRFPQGEEGAVGATITGNVAVPGPGSYELVLQIHDMIAGDTLTHRVPFTIEP